MVQYRTARARDDDGLRSSLVARSLPFLFKYVTVGESGWSIGDSPMAFIPPVPSAQSRVAASISSAASSCLCV